MKFSRHLLFFVLFFSLSLLISAQPKTARRFCDTPYVLSLIQQEIDDSKSIEQTDKRIQMLARAADFFWVFDQEKARAMFTEAFTLAKARFKEKGEETTKDGRLTIQIPDHRFTVLNAITRRDSKWAKRLVQDMQKEAEEDAKTNASKKKNGIFNDGDNLFLMARGLFDTDRESAMGYARMAMNYPLTQFAVSFFLAYLAEKDQATADKFFSEILNAKSNSPIKELLYISAYPFGRARNFGPEAMYTMSQFKPDFVPNPTLQKAFINLLLQRGVKLVTQQNEVSTNTELQSDVEYLFIALVEIEPIVIEKFDELTDRLQQTTGQLDALLTPQSRNKAANIARQNEQSKQPPKSLEERLEEIGKDKNVDRRDFLYAMLFTGVTTEEKLKPLEPVLDKFADNEVRKQVSDYYYFQRSQAAIKDNRLEDAEKYAAKVGLLEQRAGLIFEIAESSIKKDNNRDKAAEVLEEAKAAALRANDSLERARAFLGVANLYEQFDHQRAIDNLGEAVKTINKLEDPNLSFPSVNRKIEMKYGASYTRYQVPGYDFDRTVRNIGKQDFEGALLQVKNLQDRYLRIVSIINLANDCVEKPTKTPKSKDSKESKESKEVKPKP